MGNRPADQAVSQLIEEAERAAARGDLQSANHYLGEAANVLVERGEWSEAIDLCVTKRDFVRAAQIAERAHDF